MPTIKELQKSKNIAELLTEEQLVQIGMDVVHGYEIDEDSRSEWKDIVDKALIIAKQIVEPKTFPWPNAANIKFPIITRASIDYAARTMPEIIQNDKVVKTVIQGQDPKGTKQLRADRVANYMSYQLVQKSPDWEDGMDKLLQILPVLGTVFKKTYWNETQRRCCSELCVPDKIVVNYSAPSLENASRITHILTMYMNDIIEKQRRGIYRDDIEPELLKPQNIQYIQDPNYQIDLLEQHCWLDLDEDNYKEPYVVTVHKDTKTVLRIVSRFKNIEKDNDVVLCIEPEQYFTDFHFIRSPDGGFYSMGFGSLLLPLNTAINTIINQLLDAGTLSNTQGGFYSSRLRLKAGDLKAKMGVFQKIDAPSGESIEKSIFPLPFKEPSQTLFQLLGMLIQVSNDLSATTDVLMGKQPAQNVASNTVSQLVEQGTKVFTAINKRVYRSLKKEYQKLYELNYYYLSEKEYQKTLDDPMANVKQDFELDSLDIYPVADPIMSSDQQRLVRASIIAQLRTIDHRAADQLVLDSLQLDEEQKKKLLPPPDPNAPPPPEVQKIMAEVQAIQANIAKLSADATLNAEKVGMDKSKLALELKSMESQIMESAARVAKMQHDAVGNQQKLMNTEVKIASEADLKQHALIHKIDDSNQKNTLKALEIASEVSTKSKELDLRQQEVKDDS